LTTTSARLWVRFSKGTYVATLFRVHTTDGKHVDVTADNPTIARSIAQKRLPDKAIITKVKVVKERADA